MIVFVWWPNGINCEEEKIPTQKQLIDVIQYTKSNQIKLNQSVQYVCMRCCNLIIKDFLSFIKLIHLVQRVIAENYWQDIYKQKFKAWIIISSYLSICLLCCFASSSSSAYSMFVLSSSYKIIITYHLSNEQSRWW